MRTGKFIFILFLFCSLAMQVAGLQTASVCGSDSPGIYSNSGSRNDNIESFNFFDENLFDEIEEFEEFEYHNDRKIKKIFSQHLLFLERMHFKCISEYKSRKNTHKAGKYNTPLKHIILLL